MEKINNNLSSIQTKLEKAIIKSEYNHKTSNHELKNLKKHTMKTQVMIEYYEIIQKKSFIKQIKKLEYINKQIKALYEYLSLNIQEDSRTNLNVIALLSVIGWPLGVITGFFSMHFKYMGVDTSISKNNNLINLTIF